MLVWVGKEGDDVIIIGQVMLAKFRLFGGVAFVLAKLLCIGRVCHLYDSDCVCHINTVLLIVN